MSDDQDDTKRRRRIIGATERDIASLARMREQARAERAKSQAELDAKFDDPVPLHELDDEDTGITPKIESDPELHRIFLKIEKAKQSAQREMEKANRHLSGQLSDRILEVAGERPPAERIGIIERTVRTVRYIVVALVIPVVASAVITVRYVYTKGGSDMAVQLEREQSAADVAALKQLIADQAKQFDAVREDLARAQQQLIDLARTRGGGADSSHRRDP